MSVKVVTYLTKIEAEQLQELCNHHKCSQYALLQRYVREGLNRDLPLILPKKAPTLRER